MNEKESRKAGPSFFLGLAVITVGALLLMERFGYVDADRLFDYWPLILVVVGINKLAYGRDRGARVFGALVAVVGVGLFLKRLGFLILEWNLIFPIALIGLGVYLIMRSRWQTKGERALSYDISVLNEWAAFGGGKITNNSSAFQGGEVLAVFGGYEVDLREAKLSGNEAELRLYAFFGGVELKVPQNWNVINKSVPILGGCEDKTIARTREMTSADPVLIVKGIAMFGGIEIHN